MVREDADERALLQEDGPRQQTDAAVVRTRLTVCIFLYTIGSSVVTQVYPKVVLLYFRGDDGEASKYNGWLAAAVSVVQLLFVPVLSGISDAVGRRTVVAWALILHGGSVFTLAATPSCLISVTVCRLVSGLGTVIIPLSQAIMIDIAKDGGKDATHGLGVAFAAFALATSVGDIVGGALSEHNRSAACLLCGTLSVLALLFLVLFGWEETAPKRDRGRGEEAEEGVTTTAAGGGGDRGRRWRRSKISNPLLILKVFLESRVLLKIALSYFLFVVSLNVFAAGYNYLDFRFNWTPLEISYFFATFNVFMALAGGLGIRTLVPKPLSEEYGALFGISVQACAGAVYGLCFRGWMLYPALALGALQNITEPCVQAIMASFVSVNRQGSLQGAVMSLRVVGEGVAAPVFTQIFSAGSSVGFEQAPFFLAAAVSLVSLAVAWWPLRELDKANKKPPHETQTTPSDALMEDGACSTPADEGVTGVKGARVGNGVAGGEQDSHGPGDDTSRSSTAGVQAPPSGNGGRMPFLSKASAAEAEAVADDEDEETTSEVIRPLLKDTTVEAGDADGDTTASDLTQPLLASPAPGWG